MKAGFNATAHCCNPGATHFSGPFLTEHQRLPLAGSRKSKTQLLEPDAGRHGHGQRATWTWTSIGEPSLHGKERHGHAAKLASTTAQQKIGPLLRKKLFALSNEVPPGSLKLLPDGHLSLRRPHAPRTMFSGVANVTASLSCQCSAGAGAAGPLPRLNLAG